MNKEKLLAIAKCIREEKVLKLDMETWKNQCGTAACAIGTAMVRGVLPELEFLWRKNIIDPRIGHWQICLTGSTDVVMGFEAIAEALEICEEEAEALFGAQNYETDDNGNINREEVANYIENFIMTDGGLN